MLFYNPIVYINRDVNGWFHVDNFRSMEFEQEIQIYIFMTLFMFNKLFHATLHAIDFFSTLDLGATWSAALMFHSHLSEGAWR